MPGMPPYMIANGTPQAMGGKVPPGHQVMMIPMPQMPQVAAPGMVRMDRQSMDGSAMLPETVGPAVVQMPYPMDPNQCARQSPTSYGYAPTQQFADSSPYNRDTSMYSGSSPNYQSAEAYERYVKDIMNAEGDDFQFDWPRRGPAGHGSRDVMMADKTRLPDSEVSTDEGAWSYASEASNSGRWFNSPNLVLSP